MDRYLGQGQNKNATVFFFHNFKYLMNFFSILNEIKFCRKFLQKYLPSKASNFFWKNLLFFLILSIFKIIKFEKKLVVFKKVVGRVVFRGLVDIECQRLGVF